MQLKAQRIGEVRLNNKGEKMTISKYNGVRDIDVVFENGEIVQHRLYKDFIDGRIKKPMSQTIFGKGIIDQKNLVWDNDNHTIKKSYLHWVGILKRCFDEKLHKEHPTYNNCKVCAEWLYLSKFTEWFKENYYEIPNCKYRMELDKDILSRYYFNECKIYSPKTSCFVPRDINLLLCKRDNCRGDFPVGVSKCNKGGYVARLNIDGKRKYLGYRKTPESAFLLYKAAKEKEIKRKAELYRNYIPNKVYVALVNYTVNIND